MRRLMGVWDWAPLALPWRLPWMHPCHPYAPDGMRPVLHLPPYGRRVFFVGSRAHGLARDALWVGGDRVLRAYQDLIPRADRLDLFGRE